MKRNAPRMAVTLREYAAHRLSTLARSIVRRVRPARAPSRRDATFAGAEVNRLFIDWLSSVKTADEEIRPGLRRLRGRARALARNDGYTKKFMLLLATNVIGPAGFKLQSKVKDDAGELLDDVNTPIEKAWRAWSEGKVTVDGKLSFVPLEQLLLKSVGRDGEIFVRLYRGFPANPHGLALQAIDPDVLDENLNLPRGVNQNEIRLGVEVNEFGRPLAYHFNRSDRSGRDRVLAEEIIHLYLPDRINQTRGVTWLHSIMAPLKMLGGYEEAEVVAARSAAAKMGWIQAKDNALTDIGMTLDKTIEMDAAPGTIEQLPAGWEFHGWSPDHPTGAFAPFVKGCLRKIATGLGVSYNALASDLEGVNYSSMRSGLLLERELWQLLQAWWIADFRRAIFDAWLPLALLTGELVLPTGRDPRDVNEPKWTPRGWSWVDPLKDVKAAQEAVNNGLGSRTQYLAEQGLEFEGVLDELAAEEALADKKGVTIAGTMKQAGT